MVSCFGVAFKPDIDDLRESPAVEVVKAVLDLDDVIVSVVEPHISSLPTELLKLRPQRNS